MRNLYRLLYSKPDITVAVAILMHISTIELPSLERVAPKYSKLFASSTCTPFMYISALLQFAVAYRLQNNDAQTYPYLVLMYIL